MWEIEYTPEFNDWWETLTVEEQDSVDTVVLMLAERGPKLGRPHADTLNDSEFANMKELRVQHAGRPLRILFVFDPRRTALLLCGGGKTGDGQFYARMIRLADNLYREHLKALEKEKE